MGILGNLAGIFTGKSVDLGAGNFINYLEDLKNRELDEGNLKILISKFDAIIRILNNKAELSKASKLEEIKNKISNRNPPKVLQTDISQIRLLFPKSK